MSEELQERESTSIADLPLRFALALLAFTFTGWIGWLGLVLILLRILGVILWPWWLVALPLEYGIVYCVYMTVDGFRYRRGSTPMGAFARQTQGPLAELIDLQSPTPSRPRSITEVPDALRSMLEISLFNLEAGARSFTQYSERMRHDLPRDTNTDFHFRTVYKVLGERFPFKGIDLVDNSWPTDATSDQEELIRGETNRVWQELADEGKLDGAFD